MPWIYFVFSSDGSHSSNFSVSISFVVLAKEFKVRILHLPLVNIYLYPLLNTQAVCLRTRDAAVPAELIGAPVLSICQFVYSVY